MEEEARLFYVACTRARKRLVLPYANFSANTPAVPSRFLSRLMEPEQKGGADQSGRHPAVSGADDRAQEFRPRPGGECQPRKGNLYRFLWQKRNPHPDHPDFKDGHGAAACFPKGREAIKKDGRMVLPSFCLCLADNLDRDRLVAGGHLHRFYGGVGHPVCFDAGEDVLPIFSRGTKPRHSPLSFVTPICSLSSPM